MILIHVCCGPCLLYPLAWFRERGIEVVGYFYNPNIHPYREFKARIKALEEVEALKGLNILWDKNYGLRWFIKETLMVWENPQKRCERCYVVRLKQTVKKALELKAEAFTTTLLYSIYQRHNLIREIAEDLSHKYKIPFFYEDFRKGYQLGQQEALNIGIYRQAYCGCVFSEEERYSKTRKKELNKSLKKEE
ncbi:epoxyqueuosine reductase QueH [Thermodesulfobacterium sp. TA1]|uniref:epoxyqueuosine reductase QueH n=1 Tax=Thermodesulfobacterium sp. TA1 TaxID=2234087 RepID=UPI0012326AB7|nr:epoxyqueuosine reductase QueH [Thermodesulfobacterium sp. TA1]QER41268.1 epoxyqueuosine reductase QueH [Thermodesulfobacterium sp. TA1]